jgi:hypothetical protein
MEKYPSISFVLNHFNEPIFLRRIYTPIRKQIEVRTESEISSYFKEANFIDCRINAYPIREEWGIKLLGQEPDFIFIDLDLENFKSKNALENARRKTLNNIKDKLGNGYPSVIESGNGYHIYQPIDAFVLESESIFADYSRASERFLKFAEWYLSAGKADSNHNPTFASCLLRVPETINSKTNTEVKIVQEWDGYRPNIRYILLKYESWLLSEEYKGRKIDSKLNAYKRSKYSSSMNVANIYWIENLLKEKPLEDLRKFVCYWILSRYLINVRRLSPEQSYSIMMDWLQRCNRLRRLSPSLHEFKRRVKRDIREAVKSGKVPIGKQLLKDNNLL